MLGAIISVGLLALILWANWPLPSDQETITLFEKHRSDFEALVTMVREDKSNGIIPKDCWIKIDPSRDNPEVPDSPIPQMSQLRFQEYKQRFKNIGLTYGIGLGRSSEITFETAYRSTSAISPYSIKGLVWKPESRNPQILADLDNRNFPQKNGGPAAGIFLKKLSADWFVYRIESD